MATRNGLCALLTITLFLSTICCVFAASESIASDPAPSISHPQATIDDQIVSVDQWRFNKSQLIWDFTNIAFSGALWLGNTVTPWTTIDDLGQRSATRRGAPKHAETPLPRFGATAKWTHEELTVGVYDGQDPLVDQRILTQFYQLVETQVEILNPQIRASTRLSLKLLPLSDTVGAKSALADVRIYPVATTHLRNRFKTLWRHPYVLTGKGRNEALFYGAVPFTPASKAQVDGFLLPASDNTLSYAMCRISPTLDPNMVRALTTECIARSMGLPELAQFGRYAHKCGQQGDTIQSHNDIFSNGCYVAASPDSQLTSVFSDWNRSQDVNSLTMLYEGNRAIIDPVNPQTRQEGSPDSFQQPLTDHADSLPSRLTPYDMALLSMLYCPALTPGMDKYQAINALYTHSECFPH